MVMSRVDERLEEISDLLNDIVTEEENLISIKRLCINIAEFQNDDRLDNREKKEFWARFDKLIQQEVH